MSRQSVVVGEELAEREDGEALRVDLGDDAPLDVVELRLVVARSDGGSCGSRGRGRAARRSPGSRAARAPLATLFTRCANFVFVLCIVWRRCVGAGRLPYSRDRDLRLLHLPRLAAAAAGARGASPARPSATCCTASTSSRRGALATRHNLEREGAPPLWARGGREGAEARARGGGRLRRGLRDRARVAADREPRGRRLLDGRHGRDPADAPEARGPLRPPLVYAAIGLPERLRQLRSERMRRLYASSLGACAAVIAYSEHEAEDIRALGRAGRRCGRGSSSSRSASTSGRSRRTAGTRRAMSSRSGPTRTATSSCSCGSRRGCPTSASASSRAPITRAGSRRRPANVTLESDLPFEEMRRRLAEARLVALPVRENSYSGATTVLLQAMALEKPVVVTRTSAIATGYGLVDGENCRLVAPGDDDGLRARARGRPARRLPRARARRERPGDRRARARRGSATSIGSRRCSGRGGRARPDRDATKRSTGSTSLGASRRPGAVQVLGQLGGGARSPTGGTRRRAR